MDVEKEARQTRLGCTLRGSKRVVTLVALLAACGSSPVSPPVGAGQFTANMTGTVTAEITGTAKSFGTATGTPAWAMQMVATDGSGGITFSEDGMPRPGTGTYTIASALEHGGNAPNSEFTAVVGVSSPAASFASISGTLTITASSATSVSGEFSFTAEDPDDASRTVTVTGSFTADNLDG